MAKESRWDLRMTDMAAIVPGPCAAQSHPRGCNICTQFAAVTMR